MKGIRRSMETEIPPGGRMDTWDITEDISENVTVGDIVEFSKEIDEADIRRFAIASGDTNPLHLDEEYAEDTMFGGKIVHGVLVSGLVSAALARLPGTIVYLQQDTQFVGPARPGYRLFAECEVIEQINDDHFRLSTNVTSNEHDVITGEATILVK